MKSLLLKGVSLLVVLTSIIVGSDCHKSGLNLNSQTDIRGTGSENPGYTGSLLGTLVSDVPLTLAPGDSFDESADKTSLPKLSLEFLNPQSEKVRLELPSAATDILSDYLHYRLHYCSLQRTERSSEAAQKRDGDLLRKANEIRNALLAVDINAPDGMRKITYEEAGNMIEFVSKASDSICSANSNMP